MVALSIYSAGNLESRGIEAGKEGDEVLLLERGLGQLLAEEPVGAGKPRREGCSTSLAHPYALWQHALHLGAL